VAESFGVDPERYDRTRPDYPDPMVRRIVAASGTRILDVGCGTGIVARQFQAAGCTVLGVEPDPRMAGFARQRGLEVEVATFEAWDGGGREFDAVVAGQAWHWVDPVAGAERAARVLRPGGRLAVFWNSFEPPPGLAEAFGAVYRRVLPDAPIPQGAPPGADGYLALCARAAEGVRQTGAFGEPEQWRYDWERYVTRDQWLDEVPTSGLATRLPPATLRDLLDGLGEAVDAVGGGFPIRHATVVCAAERTIR
jgi:SAM-dependent methyltransferase